MKAKLILFCALMSLCGNAFAQDIIHTIDGRSIEAKVLEINDDDILYKTFDNLDGPNYRMSVSRVASIVFQNGTERAFAPSTILVPSPYSSGRYGPDGPLEYRRGHYYDRHGRVYADQLRDYLGVSIYGSDYVKAKSQYSWGSYLTVTGTMLVAFSAIGGGASAGSSAWAQRHGLDAKGGGTLFIGTLVTGAAALGVGIPLWIKGNRKMNAIADDYNRRYGGGAYGYNPSLSFGGTGNGVGLALKF